MNYYLAPMEGITGYVYRRAYDACFRPMDKYFTPFLTPKQSGGLTSREKNDILPEHNPGMKVVPQILTNRAADFLKAADELKTYGYRELNLNLGCPSATVAAKGKGAGFLEFPDALKSFLDEVFEGLEKRSMELSIKTRLGKDEPGEFERLLELFNGCPVKELIVHPRVLKDFYGGTPRMEYFSMAMEKSHCPVCYNGDIFTAQSAWETEEKYPKLQRIMLGRGVLMNPWLTAAAEKEEQREDLKQQLRRFHGLVYEGYRGTMPGERPVLFKMKELWGYLIRLFPEGASYMKQIKKAQHLGQYEAAVQTLFRECELQNIF